MSRTKTKAADETVEEEKKGGGKAKLLVIVVVLLAVVGGAGYWFVLKPKSGPPKPPDPGVVVALDAIQINLADEHYLKLGLALQASKSAGEEVDGSKALDQAIALFSGRSMDQLARSAYRQKLKHELEHRLDKAYDGDVIGVYFTDFVTQ
jgi:flagellar protein FliL